MTSVGTSDHHQPWRRPTRRGALGLLLAGSLAACSSANDSINKQAQQGDDKGYVAGDGSVTTLAPGKRGKPVQLSGKLLTGAAWSIADVSGKVVVVNVWGSWCPPCQAEIPALQKAWTTWQQAGDPVQLIGVDQKEDPATGLAGLQAKGATYPSLADDGGQALIALQGKATATPTTLVLDKQHRIAARVLGPVTTALVAGLVDDVLKGK